MTAATTAVGIRAVAAAAAAAIATTALIIGVAALHVATPAAAAHLVSSGAALVQDLHAPPPPLRSGGFVPLGSSTGPLGCPESRRNTDGIGHCIGLRPHGVAWPPSSANGATASRPDVFMQCNAQSGPPSGNNYAYRLRYQGSDNTTGAPVFATPVRVTAPLVTDTRAGSGTVVQVGGATGTTYGAWLSDGLLIVAYFDWATDAFVTLANASLAPLDLPHGPSALAVVPRGERPDDGADIVFSISDGAVYKPHDTDPTTGEPISWRSPAYRPYDGAGIYRGQLGWSSLWAATVDTLPTPGPGGRAGGAASLPLALHSPRRVSPTETDALMGHNAVSPINLGGGVRGLVSGSKNGNIFLRSNLTGEPVAVASATTNASLRHPTIGAAPIAFPRAHSGATASAAHVSPELPDDVLVAGENALWFIAATGSTLNRGSPVPGSYPSAASAVPVYSAPVPALQSADPVLLFAGSTPTVSVGDWDLDGDTDAMFGNAAGFVTVSINTGNDTAPAFAPPAPVTLSGAPASSATSYDGDGVAFGAIHIQGGYRRDVQGPDEARWGYAGPTMVDWNGDGLMDIVMSDNTARTTVLLRRRVASGPVIVGGSSSSDLQLRPGVPLFFGGLVLHGTWRCQPAAAALGSPPRMALVTLDDGDAVHLYWRYDDHNLVDGGRVQYAVDGSGNTADVHANYLSAGGTGRLRMQLADLDGDGLHDLVLGVCGYHAVPNNLTGLPGCEMRNATGKCGNNGASVLWMRQLPAQGASRGQVAGGAHEQPNYWDPATPLPVFDTPRYVVPQGSRLWMGGQEVSAAATRHLGPPVAADKVANLVVAQPGGHYLFFDGRDLAL